MNRFKAGVGIVIACVLALSAAAWAAPKFISIATGGTGGAYFPIGAGLADIINKKLTGYNASAEVPPSYAIMARTPSSATAPTTVRTTPRLRGTIPTTRSPLGPRAYSRVIDVCVPVSSTKTRREGAMLATVLRKPSRQAVMRGVSRSLATRDFFFA